MSRHDIAGNHLGCILLKTPGISFLTGPDFLDELSPTARAIIDPHVFRNSGNLRTNLSSRSVGDLGCAFNAEQSRSDQISRNVGAGRRHGPLRWPAHMARRCGGRLGGQPPVDVWRVSCHDTVSLEIIWVAFFSRWQRYRCGQVAVRGPRAVEQRGGAGNVGVRLTGLCR